MTENGAVLFAAPAGLSNQSAFSVPESDSVFSVSGQRVVRPPEVTLPEPIVAGSYARVGGVLSNGVLRATGILVLGSGRPYMLDGRIESIDVASRTFRMLSIQFFVNEWTRFFTSRGSLNDFAVGNVVSVWAHSNGFVRSFQLPWPNHPVSVVEGEWFSGVSQPIGFTVRSVVDFPVQVTPTTRFFLTYRAGDGECYGADPISQAEFWQRATAPRPAGATSILTSGAAWREDIDRRRGLAVLSVRSAAVSKQVFA